MMPMPWFPARLKLMVTTFPASTVFRVGGLLVGLKKPLKSNTTRYARVTTLGLPALSRALTAKVFCPTEFVSIGLPLETGPAQTAIPEPGRAAVTGFYNFVKFVGRCVEWGAQRDGRWRWCPVPGSTRLPWT